MLHLIGVYNYDYFGNSYSYDIATGIFGNENYIITNDYSGNISNHIMHHTFGNKSYITIKIMLTEMPDTA